MTIQTCDCCGKQTERLNQLNDDYKVDRIAEVCDDCLKEINDLFFRCYKAQMIQRNNFIRRFILSLKK